MWGLNLAIRAQLFVSLVLSINALHKSRSAAVPSAPLFFHTREALP
jgi:hypothetical protein